VRSAFPFPSPFEPVSRLSRRLDDIQSSKSALHPLPSSLSSRKSSSISIPSSPPSFSDVSAVALPSLLLLSRLAPSPHALTTILTSLTTFLDRHTPASSSSGALWQSSTQPLVLFLARDCVLSVSSDALKPTAAGWWVDRIAEIYDTGAESKSSSLLYVLKNLLSSSSTGTAEVSKSSALHTLLELLVRRARFRPRGVLSPHHSPNVSRGHLAIPRDSEDGGSPSHSPSRAAAEEDDEADLDPLLSPLYSTISALARAASTGGYRSELSDLASDVVSLLRSLASTNGTERATRLLRGMSEEEKRRARGRVSKALRVLIEAGETLTGAVEVKEAPVVDGSEAESKRGRLERNEGSAATLLARSPPQPKVEESSIGEKNGTMRAPPFSIPGLHLGAVVGEGEGDATIRVSKSSNGSSSSASFQSRPPIPQQILTPASPSSSFPSLPLASVTAPSTSSSSNRNPISLSTFAPSLIVLTSPSPSLRQSYIKTLRTYLAREAPAALAAASPAEQARFWRAVYGAVYALASGEISTGSPGGSSKANSSPPSDGSHPTSPITELVSSSSPPIEAVLPTPTDYSSLASLLPLFSSASPSATSVLEGLPALLALDGAAATNWKVGLAGGEFAVESGGVGRDAERAKACRDLAALGVREVGRSWGVEEVEKIGEAVRFPLLRPFPSASNLGHLLLPIRATNIFFSYRL
jgi:hypothetical protein